MALVAVHAVVHIPADVRMMEIVRVSAPMARTVGAREHRVVVGIDVAGRAHTGGVTVIDVPPRVAKGRPGPCRGGVTCGARGGEDRGRGFMDRIAGAVVIDRVTSVAGRRERGVVVIYMATGASDLGVEAGQRECCGAVVKFAIGPQRGVVAELAGRGETHLDVVDRSGRRVIGVQVAGYAGGVRAGQIIVVVDVAIGAQAWRHGVRVGQREARAGVIELSIRPQHRVVAAFARRREARLDMVHGSGRGVVVLQMAGRAGGGGQVVVVVDVAVEAHPRRIGVGVREREAYRRVVKGGRLPGAGVVALLAGLREASGDVVGILGALVIRQMTAHACRARQVVVVMDVAVEAHPRRIGVRIRKREAHGGVVKRGGLPGAGVVAGLASLRETPGDVIWICRTLKIAQVAGDAGGAGEVVVVVDVAVEAHPRRVGVRIGQGEAGGGVIKLSVGPGHRVVAALAGRRKAQLHMVHRTAR